MDDDASSDGGMDGSFPNSKMQTSVSSTATLDTETDTTNSSMSQSSNSEYDIEMNDNQRQTLPSMPSSGTGVQSTDRFLRSVSPSSIVVEATLPQPSPLGLRHRDYHADHADLDLEKNTPSPGRLTCRKPSKPYLSPWDESCANTDEEDIITSMDQWDENVSFEQGCAFENSQHQNSNFKENTTLTTGWRGKMQKLLRGLTHVNRSSEGKLFKLCLSLASFIVVLQLLPFQMGNARARHTLDMDTKMVLLDERKIILSKIKDDHVPWSESEAYSVQLSTKSGRVDLVKNSLDAHAACPSVRSIQVQWDESRMGAAPVPKAISNHPSGKVKVVTSTGSATEGSETSKGDPNAVLLLSDDLVFSCDELDRAFRVWTRNPDRMVGFFPHQHSKGSSYRSWKLEEVQRGQGKYSVLSDRAAFVHKEYLNSHLSAVRTGFGRCDAFGLSLGITAVSSKPPISVLASPIELRSSSYSHQERKHTIQGSDTCLTGLMESLNLSDLPTQQTTYIGG